MSRKKKRFDASSRSSKHLVEKYTALHEGRKPDKQLREKLRAPPKYYVDLGPIPEFTYFKKTPDGVHPYRHEFAEWAMPTLVHDERGKLHIVDQDGLKTTSAGIEDNTMARRRRHHRSIARMNPSYAGSRFLSARHNPFNGTAIKKAAVASGVVGLGVAATVLGMQWLFSKVSFLGNLTGYSSAAAKAGIGIAGSVLVQGLAGAPSGKTNAADVIAASIGIGGVSLAGLQVYATATAPAAPAAPAATAPASAAYRRR